MCVAYCILLISVSLMTCFFVVKPVRLTLLYYRLLTYLLAYSPRRSTARAASKLCIMNGFCDSRRMPWISLIDSGFPDNDWISWISWIFHEFRFWGRPESRCDQADVVFTMSRRTKSNMLNYSDRSFDLSDKAFTRIYRRSATAVGPTIDPCKRPVSIVWQNCVAAEIRSSVRSCAYQLMLCRHANKIDWLLHWNRAILQQFA